MPLRYFHSGRLAPLFSALHDEIRCERQKLPPQKTQVIIVGNLETEAWITRRFLAADGVLMGVSFPFLEAAIQNFSEWLERKIAPANSESWFLPPAGERSKALGIAELEVLLLGVLTDKANAELLHGLGYGNDGLTPSKLTTLAALLADELREAILHCPGLLRRVGTGNQLSLSAGEKLWRTVYRALEATGRPFPAFEPGLAERIVAQSFPAGAATETLHLFGMPVLSEYHVRILAAIARHMTVNLYMTDLSGYAASENHLLATAGRKAAAFVSLLHQACESYAAPFFETAITADALPGRTFALYALPGIWRGAEHMGDVFHDILARNPQLYQNDIGVSLTDPGVQYAAFERALAMRQLVAFSRERFYEVPDPLAELWQIIADAVQAGLSRSLLVRYALHPLVAAKYSHDPEKIVLWLSALDRAHGYRDDYPEAQAVFNLEAALRRMERGVIIGNAYDPALPAAHALRPFDSPDFAQGLHNFLRPLLSARTRLSAFTGEKLAEAMQALQQEISAAGESVQKLANWFDQVRNLQGFDGLTLPHVVRLLKRHLPGKSLAQQTSREGITFSSLAASCFTRDTQLLFDLSEDADRQERQTDFLFPEIQSAATRFTRFEQLAYQLAKALNSDARFVILAYSAQDPASGAEKYPSQALSEARLAAEVTGRTEAASHRFPATLLQNDTSLPPLASDADRRTAWLLQNRSASNAPLSAHTLPRLHKIDQTPEIDLHDLMAYLRNPARYVLRRHLPPELQIAAFGREEPKLAVGTDARLRFCEEYLEHTLLDASAAVVPDARSFTRFRQARGDYAPEGFDQAGRLLDEPENNRRLTLCADKLRSELRLVEYIFHAGISKPFSVAETPRLTREYHPAPRLSETSITGSSGILLQDTEGQMFRLQSAIYGDRNAALIELHLLLCVFALADRKFAGLTITLADFATNTRSKDPFAVIGFTPRTGLALRGADSAGAYVNKLLTALRAQRIVWYDHSLLKQPKLSEWSGLSSGALLQRLSKPPEQNTSEELQRLQRHFALEADSGSVDFFDDFIRPVALLDMQGKTDSIPAEASSRTAGRTSRKRAGKG